MVRALLFGFHLSDRLICFSPKFPTDLGAIAALDATSVSLSVAAGRSQHIQSSGADGVLMVCFPGCIILNLEMGMTHTHFSVARSFENRTGAYHRTQG